MSMLNLKPTHKPIREYYDELKKLGQLDLYSEGQVSPAFAAMLRHCGSKFGWTLAEKYPLKRQSHSLWLDGALLDQFKLLHGVWEAKDTKDDLDVV